MTVEPRPLVTVLVPARDEARDIADCLAAVQRQSYPPERLEVIVVTGGSSDDTAGRARGVLAGAGFHRSVVIEEAPGSTPGNLNAGLAAATGELVCRVDARSIVPADYVERCVAVLAARPDVVVTGGSQVAVAAPGAGPIPRGIARALRNPYATGLARYRRRRTSGPTDTVYLGAFRTVDLRAEGGWDERFATNQDYELNRRLSTRGTVWFEADLPVVYRPRPTLGALARQHRRFGRWKAAGWLEADVSLAPRQIVLLVGPPVALTAGLVVARRHPLTAGAAAAAAPVVLDLVAGDPAPLADRVAGVVAVGVLGTCWWLGTAEQAVRYLRGERLLGARLASVQATRSDLQGRDRG